MYLVKILNADHRPVDVEVSLEIYRVYEESRKQEERQRYERRKHIEGKSFDDCLMFDLATEPLEETAERLETLLEIGQVLEKLPPLQRWRFILHFFYGYSYSEIAKMQDCNKSAVMRSVQSALKKVRKNCIMERRNCWSRNGKKIFYRHVRLPDERTRVGKTCGDPAKTRVCRGGERRRSGYHCL